MSKATEMAKVSAKGGFHLLWALVVSTIISAVATIVIARFARFQAITVYMPSHLRAPNLISTFRDGG